MLTSLRNELPNGCISDLTFDTWRAGELEPGRVGELQEHLVACVPCRQRHEALERQAAQFLAQAPALVARAHSPNGAAPQAVAMGPRRARRRWLAPSALLVSAAAAVALWLRPAPGSRERADDTRSKGHVHLSFHVQHGLAVHPGTEGQVVFPGDRLRFSITTARPAHVAILSLDGAGVASVYFPPGNTSRPFGPVSSQPVDSSVVLDNTLGRERLWALFCDGEFALEPLRSRLAREGALHAPAGCTVEEHTLSKQSVP